MTIPPPISYVRKGLPPLEGLFAVFLISYTMSDNLYLKHLADDLFVFTFAQGK